MTISRDDVIGWAREAGIEVHERKQQARFGLDALLGEDSTAKLQRMCELAAAAERRKHQADIEAWKAEAATAEKWRGMALAKDPMQPGKAVQEIQRDAVEREREACAAACDALVDEKEAARIRNRVNEALQSGDEEDQLQAMRHETTVSTFNAGIKSCAKAIRARSLP